MEKNLHDILHVTVRRFGLLNKNCCCECCDINAINSHLLYEIYNKEHSSMQEIANSIGTDITTFSRQIQNLIKEGLIEKKQSENDKRIYLLSLTENGKKAIGTYSKQMNHHLESIFSNLNEFERETVIRSLELLNKAMSESSVCCKPLYK